MEKSGSCISSLELRLHVPEALPWVWIHLRLTILTIFPRNGESGSNHKKRSKKKGEVKATFRYRGKGAFNQGTHFLINQKGKEITILEEYYLRSQLYFSSKKKKYVFCSVLKFQTQRCRYAELSAFKDWAISTEPNMASTRQKCAIHS